MAETDRARFLNTRASRILTAILLAQALVLYGFSREEVKPVKEPLTSLPTTLDPWHMTKEFALDQEVLDVLKADETLSRLYHEGNQPLSTQLFVAYFDSQRTGRAPHSPKNCMPGSGWFASSSEKILIPVKGFAPVEANRYIVFKGDAKSVVLYWYQSRDRTIASEYKAKIYAVLDAIRYNRSDTALVRVVVPVAGNEQESAEVAIKFVQAMYPSLRKVLPS
jgi:EpsI family protein